MEKFLLIFCVEGKSLTASILRDKLYKNLRGPSLPICNLPFTIYNIQYNILTIDYTFLSQSPHSPFSRKEILSLLPGQGGTIV